MSKGRALLAVFLLALVVRLAYLFEIRHGPLTDLLLIDSETYDRFAHRILAGTFRGEEVYSVNVLYPYFLAAVYALSHASRMVVLVVQAVLDAASAAILFAVGVPLFDRRTALAAALAAALYGPLVFYAGALLTPTIITFLTMVTLLFLVLWKERRSLRLALGAGITLGLAALARGNNNLLIPLALPYFAVHAGGWRRGLRPWGVFLAGALFFPALVTVRNARVEGEFVPVAANYAAFYIGHDAGATGLYHMTEFVEGARFEQEVEATRRAVSEEVGHPVTLAESARHLFVEGTRYALGHPGHEFALSLRKIFYFFNRTESPTNLNYHFALDNSRLLRALPLTFGIIAPLGLVGMALSWSRWRELLPLHLLVAVPLVTCILFYMSAEYRLPAVPPLLLFAAYGTIVPGARLGRLLSRGTGDRQGQRGDRGEERRGRGRRSAGAAPAIPRREAIALALLPILFFASNVSTHLLRHQRLKRVDYLNAGTLYLDRDDLDHAEAMLRRSIEIDPDFGPAYTRLAEIERRRGNDLAAARLLRRAQATSPGGQYTDMVPQASPAAAEMLVIGERYQAGDYQGALDDFREMRERYAKRGDTDLLRRLDNNIGLCFFRLGRLDEAEGIYRTLLAQDPSYVRALTNLALVLEAKGDDAGALPLYLRARGIEPMNESANRGIARLGGAAGASKSAPSGSDPASSGETP